MRKIIITSQGKGLLAGGSILAVQDGLLPSDYRRLTGIGFNGNVMYDTGIFLYGSDTLSFSFSVTKACNVLGCYTTTSATDNYSLYASLTSGASYLRYNGRTFNSYVSTNTTYDVVITPTGTSGMKVDSTWTAQTFTTSASFLIGSTSIGATSAKLTGNMYGNVVVKDRYTFIPVERTSDGEIGYFNLENEEFIENQGTGTPTSLGYAS